MYEAIFLSIIIIFDLDQIPRIKICHMVVTEHTKVEGRRQLIAAEFLDPGKLAKGDVVDGYGAASYEEDESGSGKGTSTGVTGV